MEVGVEVGWRGGGCGCSTAGEAVGVLGGRRWHPTPLVLPAHCWGGRAHLPLNVQSTARQWSSTTSNSRCCCCCCCRPQTLNPKPRAWAARYAAGPG